VRASLALASLLVVGCATHLDRGIDACGTADFRRAREELTLALSEPGVDRDEALAWRARARVRLGDLEGAAEDVATLGSSDAAKIVALAFARRAFERARGLVDHPVEPVPTGDGEPALDDARRAVALDPSMRSLLASGFLELGRRRDGLSALRAFDAALEFDPACASAFAGRAWTLAIFGSAEDSKKDARRALELSPEDPLALLTLALATGDEGLLARQGLAPFRADRRCYVAEGLLLERRSQFAAALEEFHAALEIENVAGDHERDVVAEAIARCRKVLDRRTAVLALPGELRQTIAAMDSRTHVLVSTWRRLQAIDKRARELGDETLVALVMSETDLVRPKILTTLMRASADALVRNDLLEASYALEHVSEVAPLASRAAADEARRACGEKLLADAKAIADDDPFTALELLRAVPRVAPEIECPHAFVEKTEREVTRRGPDYVNLLQARREGDFVVVSFGLGNGSGMVAVPGKATVKIEGMEVETDVSVHDFATRDVVYGGVSYGTERIYSFPKVTCAKALIHVELTFESRYSHAVLTAAKLIRLDD